MQTIVPPEWICRKCNKLKSSSAFAKYHTICRQCYNDAVDPHEKRIRNLLRKYNLTLEQYNEMFHAQGGVCASCGQEETFFDIRTNSPALLKVDHDHKTGKVRGLLCHNCNTALGFLSDSPENIQSLLVYLSKAS